MEKPKVFLMFDRRTSRMKHDSYVKHAIGLFERAKINVIKFGYNSVDTFDRVEIDVLVLLMSAQGDSFEFMCREAMRCGIPIVVCEPDDGLYIDGMSQGLAEILSGESLVKTSIENLVRDTISVIPRFSTPQKKIFDDHQIEFAFS